MFLAHEWNSFHPMGKKLHYFHRKDFLICEWQSHIEGIIDPPSMQNHYDLQTSNHKLAIEIGWLSQYLEVIDYATHNVVQIEAHFIMEQPLHNSTRDKFPFIFKDAILDSLKSFFQLDHQVDVNISHIKATPSITLEFSNLFDTVSMLFKLCKPYDFLDMEATISLHLQQA